MELNTNESFASYHPHSLALDTKKNRISGYSNKLNEKKQNRRHRYRCGTRSLEGAEIKPASVQNETKKVNNEMVRK